MDKELVARLEAAVARLEALLVTGSRALPAGHTADEPAAVDPAIAAFDELLVNYLGRLSAAADKIGGQVQDVTKILAEAFAVLKELLIKAKQCQKHDRAGLEEFLKPLNEVILRANALAEGRRRAQFFNHLKAAADSLRALAWVAYLGKDSGMSVPISHVEESWQMAAYYNNKILMEHRTKHPNHIEWAKALKELYMPGLRDYVKSNFPLGIWGSAGVAVVSAPRSGSSVAKDPPVLAAVAFRSPPPPPPPPETAHYHPMKVRNSGTPPPPPLPSDVSALGSGSSVSKDPPFPPPPPPPSPPPPPPLMKKRMPADFRVINSTEPITSAKDPPVRTVDFCSPPSLFRHPRRLIKARLCRAIKKKCSAESLPLDASAPGSGSSVAKDPPVLAAVAFPSPPPPPPPPPPGMNKRMPADFRVINSPQSLTSETAHYHPMKVRNSGTPPPPPLPSDVSALGSGSSVAKDPPVLATVAPPPPPPPPPRMKKRMPADFRVISSTESLTSATKNGADSISSSFRREGPPRLELQMGRKWVVENLIGKSDLVIDDCDSKQTVHVYGCMDSVLQIKGKVNNIIVDKCIKTGVVFIDVVAACEIVNCNGVEVHCQHSAPTISVDNTSGCQLYLSKDSLGTSITTAQTSQINVLVPGAGTDNDWVEHALPKLSVHTFNKGKLTTSPVSHSGG